MSQGESTPPPADDETVAATGAVPVPPRRTDGGESGDGEGRKLGLIIGGVLAGGLLVGAGVALALSGGGSSDAPRAVDTGQSVTTTAGAAGGSTDASGGGTAPGRSSGGGAKSGTGTGSGTSTTTAPSGPKPTFLTAGASPGLVVCQSAGEATGVHLYWTTANATSVEVQVPGAGPGYNANTPVFALDFQCNKLNSVTIVAHGPGGSVSRTISWNSTIVTTSTKATTGTT